MEWNLYYDSFVGQYFISEDGNLATQSPNISLQNISFSSKKEADEYCNLQNACIDYIEACDNCINEEIYIGKKPKFSNDYKLLEKLDGKEFYKLTKDEILVKNEYNDYSIIMI